MMFVIVSPIAGGFPSRFTLRIVAMELPPLLVYRVRRSLRWREEDEQPQVLRDGMNLSDIALEVRWSPEQNQSVGPARAAGARSPCRPADQSASAMSLVSPG